MSTLDDLYSTRLQKLEELRKRGINVYPTKFPHNNAIKPILENFSNFEAIQVSTAGRIMSWREHGKSTFGHLQDETGDIQIYFKIDEMTEESFKLLQFLDIGDIIGIKGTAFRTHRGEITILVKEWDLLTKALRPLPEKWEGLTDKETRLRKRYLDLLMNEETRRIFKIRHSIVRGIREFLDKKGLTEVEVPILQPLYGGANAKPFTTHINSLDTGAYLKIASELYLKRLVVGGMGGVYDISKDFRNEGVDQTHYFEFTMLEAYIPYIDYQQLMDTLEEMMRYIAMDVLKTEVVKVYENEVNLNQEWKRIRMYDLISQDQGIDVTKMSDKELFAYAKSKNIDLEGNTRRGEVIFYIFDKISAKKLMNPTWVYDYPIEVSPLSKRKFGEEEIAERFELYIGGKEIMDGWSEKNDPIDQRNSFEAENYRKLDAESEVAQPIDEDFIEAMEYGMPPTAGVGVGIERLTEFFSNVWVIQETILFPFKKPVNENVKESDDGIAKLIVDKKIFENFPETKIGVVIAKDIKNGDSTPEIQALIRSESDRIKSEVTQDSLKSNQKVTAWRDAFKKFGSKPSEYRSSVENLPRMILKGRELRSENKLVDIYNYISLKYLLPAGGEDLSKIEGSIRLTLATKDESPVKLLGDDKEESPYEGEVIYKDAIGTICRRWNWREVDRTKLTRETTNAILVLESLPPVTKEELETATYELAELIKTHTGASVSTIVLDKSNPSVALSPES
ncbi:MAG: lysine--tRNA ligase [bacterium]|nr:lysine--tRNA ligase [bacterium]